MTTNQDVIVIGGGAVGSACARELAVAGRSVVVLERGRPAGEGWRAAAGMLAPQVEAEEEDPLFELGLAGRERIAELAQPLHESSGIDIQFWQGGIVRIAHSAARVTELKARVAWQRQHGHLSDWFDEDEIRSRWPWLGPSLGGLWAPQEAAVDPVKLVEALRADAARLGARFVTEEATSLERSGNRITGVVARERYSAGDVVIAAGAWSGNLLGLPRPLSVEPIRGQMAALPWPAGVEPAIIFGDGGYIVARGPEALVGSTMESAGFAPDVTPAGLAEILAGVSALCPAWAQFGITRTWAGLRPVTPDGLPIIGREPKVEGLWYATGHGRNGVLLSAITGQIMARLLAGENEMDYLHPVRPERFWNW
ncbi:MAG TPA: glycine oxidase ThiO [Gemmatimonadales bacterium]|nr:glycine oxidase ThiO [Gemmatimonadales bacterium]